MPLRCTQLEVPATRDHQTISPFPAASPRTTRGHLTTTPSSEGARGDIENRIKELKHGWRSASSSFKANQFRLLMTAAAYVLMQELRLHARRTGCARAQVNTLRLRLLKLGVWIESSVRRIVLHLPMSTADESVPCPHSQSPRAKCSTAISASPEQRTRLQIIHCACKTTITVSHPWRRQSPSRDVLAITAEAKKWQNVHE